VVPDSQLDDEVDRLTDLLLSKNQQAMRQLKLIINRGAEADLHTAQGFEELSAGLSGALNGGWQVDDADQGVGIMNFVDKGEVWQKRRAIARDFWVS
jgi:enoyl-CoA hydratase